MPKKLLEEDFDTVDLFLLNRSNLSWEERQIIEYARRYPEEKEKLLQQFENK